MPTIPLIRDALRPLFRQATQAHPGLLLQRGYPEHDEDSPDNKERHIVRVCNTRPAPFYTNAYRRWLAVTADSARFAATVLRADPRLFIGQTGGATLETGCAIQHSYGVPYLPGSAIKGAAKSYAIALGLPPEIRGELFGSAGSDTAEDLGGLINFHDVWWVPDSAPSPLVQEVVTSHHLEYYSGDGDVWPSDLDSPVPNAQVAVRGAFLFVLEGPADWLPLALDILEQALCTRGIGAKTRAGYGILRKDEKDNDQLSRGRTAAELTRAAATRRREQQRQAAQQAAELAAMAPNQRRLREVHDALQAHLELPETTRRQQRQELVGLLNGLLGEALEWTEAMDRESAATLLTACYDAIGWGDPGQKKAKRDKQERKRRDQIEPLRR